MMMIKYPWHRELAIYLAGALMCYGDGFHTYTSGRCIVCRKRETVSAPWKPMPVAERVLWAIVAAGAALWIGITLHWLP